MRLYSLGLRSQTEKSKSNAILEESVASALAMRLLCEPVVFAT